ncbi:MAG TPA: hypothetical protein VFW87_18440, partial [Pirellulales bacterium]|nr:hypothetical protein [Pirellulales bacterium]
AYACLVRIARFWGVLPHRVAAGGTSQAEPAAVRGARYAIAVWYVCVFLFALMAMAELRTAIVRPPWLWALLLAISFTAAHAIFWSDLRMRAPLAPAISLLAARGARKILSRMKRR